MQGDLRRLVDALVMMVDDEPLNLEVTQVHLEEAGYTRFMSTSEPLEAVSLAAEHRPDVLLLDLMMPGMNGFDILQCMEREGILKDVPTIVLTSSADPVTKLKALELGAIDFLAKPVDPSELVLRLRNTLAAKAYRDQLANYDLLTGLPNRNTFIARLDWALRYGERYGHSGAVLYVGLDEFKQVNGALGPRLGDTMLQGVAQRLENCLRTTDTVVRLDNGPRPSLSRLSGDEFAVVLPQISKSDDAGHIAARVLSAIAMPFRLSDHELTVTCSIGIAVFPNDGTQADVVLKNAASAMYHAKRRQKNTFQFYSSELNSRALHKLSLASLLRKAVERDELCLYYQPKVEILSGAVTGAEALVRWKHPDRGWVSPAEFIPIAEETGLIVPLGECVLRAACKQSVAWQATASIVPRIAVNVSSRQFITADFAGLLKRVLSDTRADARRFTIEITEGVLMEHTEANLKVLHTLKDMGASLSLDDFGTGYSSLSHIHMLPLDELKIDQSFVREIRTPKDRSAIVIAIIAMARSLGLRVVAEGVETSVQLDFLKAHNCDEFQGYLVSKPLPPDEFASRFIFPAHVRIK